MRALLGPGVPQAGSRRILRPEEAAMADQPSVVRTDPEILGGTPVFAGTRVPVKTLFDYLEAGDPLDRFLDQFPSVSRAQAVAALDLARSALVHNSILG